MSLPSILTILLTCCALAFSAGRATPAEAEPLQLFFVTVGSSTYGATAGAYRDGLRSIYGANNGAKALARRLARRGARFGIVLTSDHGRLVTVHDIDRALSDVHDQIKLRKATNPLLVFYFAGHGISEGIAWNHFSLPGTFDYEGDRGRLTVEALSSATLHAASLVDRLEKWEVPFLVLLDTCSEGTEATFDASVLSATAAANLNDVASALRFMNEFRIPNPVLFSTAPGSKVQVAPDPDSPAARNVGPLARRAILTLDASPDRPLRLAEFLRSMSAPDVDSLTSPAVTHAVSSELWTKEIGPALDGGVTAEERFGTGTSAVNCCPVQAADTSTDGDPSQIAGTVNLQGASGEFVTGGKKLTFAAPEWSMSLQRYAAGDVAVMIDNAEGDQSWEIALSTPDRARFVEQHYPGANRGPSGEGVPSLSISGDGRACNEVRGSFTVTKAGYDAHGGLTQLTGHGQHYCDDSAAVLEFQLDVRADDD
ncbi:MAG TPA: hypothetical protein VEL28_04685 [Candidatus Binatia bacterium]|nr:hypothetical protein [Candidatus Binatia bacterium]